MTRYHNSVELMPRDQTWRPTPNPKPRVDGPQVAFVVGPEGEEIYCDEHGRVKVQFPWDRYAPNPTKPPVVGCEWLRAGRGRLRPHCHTAHRPRGDRFLLEGDPDQPLVTGRTYHAVNTAPYPAARARRRARCCTPEPQGRRLQRTAL